MRQTALRRGLGVVARALQLVAEGIELRLGRFQVLVAEDALGGQASGALKVATGLFKPGRELADGCGGGLAVGRRAARLTIKQSGRALAAGGRMQPVQCCLGLVSLLQVFIIAQLQQQVAAGYPAVVLHRHLHNDARKSGADRHDDALDLGVIGADVLQFVLPALPAEQHQAADYCGTDH
ncbi:hypothetical protein D3C81_582180 [compost metagenome]